MVLLAAGLVVTAAPAPFVTVAVKLRVPAGPVVKVIEFEADPTAIKPPEMDHWYEAPVCAGTLAMYPDVFAVTALRTVIVVTGAAYTAIMKPVVEEVVPAALVTVMASVSEPGAPLGGLEVSVTAFAPAPEVMTWEVPVPSVKVQLKVPA